jgi:excisionase family DNA binding protein
MPGKIMLPRAGDAGKGAISGVEMEQLPLLTVREMASFLNVAPSTIYKMVERKALPVIRLGQKGRTLRFRRSDIMRWLETPDAEAQRRPDGRRVS